MKLNLLAFSVTVMLFGSTVSAAIIQPVSATSTIAGDAGSNVNWLLNDNPGYSDGDGLTVLRYPDATTGTTLVTGDTIEKALATEHAYGGSNHQESWTYNIGALPVFTFDMTGGGDTTVGSILLWQYANNGGGADRNGNQTRDFAVLFHTEAEGNIFDFDTETPDIAATMARTEGEPPATIGAQPFKLGATMDVRYAAVKILSNYLDQPDVLAGGDRYGLGEVRFASEMVPEPASMTLIGLGGLVMLLFRRK